MNIIRLMRHKVTSTSCGVRASRSPGRVRISSLVVLGLLGVPLMVGPGRQAPEAAGAQRVAAAPSVTFTGHGWGTGYGLGQWGAFGLATLDHFTYRQILAHYYADPVDPVTSATLPASIDSEVVSVAIQENDNNAVTVTSPSTFTYEEAGVGGAALRTIATIPGGHAGRAVEITHRGVLTGLWELETAPSCSATSWTEVATGLTDPIAVPSSLAPTALPGELLTLCEKAGQHVTFRGRIEAYDYYGTATGDRHLQRTVNLVALEQYVADVTPSESPSAWGTYGGALGAPQGEPWGFQELEAQAVAARTYLLYSIAGGGWKGYADICDEMCEFYGRGIQYETPLATLAATDTAGLYLVQGGAPAPTEYGPSSGGYTAALSYASGKSIFAAVPDPGDSVCIGGPESLGCNPWHSWVTTVPVTSLEKYFAVGVLESLKVLATDSSGRVRELQIVGTRATVVVPGATVAQDLGLLSTMFQVALARAVAVPPAAVAGRRVLTLAPMGAPGSRPPVGDLTLGPLKGHSARLSRTWRRVRVPRATI